MASQLDADDKQQTLDWAAARQAWDQHVEALDTDAGERADGVTALESKLGTRAHWDGRAPHYIGPERVAVQSAWWAIIFFLMSEETAVT